MGAGGRLMGDVIILPVETTLDLPLDRVLDGAREAEVSCALVLGYGKDGAFYMASQECDAGKILILLERARATVRYQLGIKA